jgi:hypothetical protein
MGTSIRLRGGNAVWKNAWENPGSGVLSRGIAHDQLDLLLRRLASVRLTPAVPADLPESVNQLAELTPCGAKQLSEPFSRNRC